MIRNLLALIGLAFVLFVVVGFAMKWYTFSRESGKLTILIFTDKVEDGLGKIRDGAAELGDNLGKALTKPSDEKKPEATGPAGLFGLPAKPASAPGTTPASLSMPGGNSGR